MIVNKITCKPEMANTAKPKASNRLRYRMVIDNSTFYVNIHFGKIPLEDILRRRVLADNETKFL